MSNDNLQLAGEWGYSVHDGNYDDSAELAFRRQQELEAEGWTQLAFTDEQDTADSGTFRLRGVAPACVGALSSASMTPTEVALARFGYYVTASGEIAHDAAGAAEALERHNARMAVVDERLVAAAEVVADEMYDVISRDGGPEKWAAKVRAWQKPQDRNPAHICNLKGWEVS